jgi:hypothetical protein
MKDFEDMMPTTRAGNPVGDTYMYHPRQARGLSCEVQCTLHVYVSRSANLVVFEALSILKPNALFLLNSFSIGNGVSEQRLQDDEASKAHS